MIPRRRCVCQLCGKQGYNDVFYRVQKKVGKKNKNIYNCNKIEYEQHRNEKIYKTKTLKYIAKHIWKFPDYRMLPSVVPKDINELADIYSYESVYNAIVNKVDTLAYWANRKDKFNNDFAKSRYLRAIIEKDLYAHYVNVENKYKRKLEIEKHLTDDSDSSIDIEVLNNMQNNKQNKKKDNSINDLLRGLDI